MEAQVSSTPMLGARGGRGKIAFHLPDWVGVGHVMLFGIGDCFGGYSR